ncbi:Conserved_hypothetical protein [Hexamita inflata]|uniref:Uncharacterized protein n=1 Tax=Hexamita inflata TaxID=28002 RepID=A0AA86NPX7_9EUKA|nr:Conserved hypothetical protein [Hexamita inflata]
MSIEAKIIPSNVQNIENLSETVYISDSNNGTGLKIYNIPMQGTNNLNDTTGLLTKGAGQTYQWNLSAGYDAVISTTNSYIKYTIQFSIPYAANTYGRYWMQNGFIFRRIITVAGENEQAAETYGDVECLSTAAMNALTILSSSTVNYGNTNATDELLNRWRGFNQMTLPSEYQDTFRKTWFDGYIPVIDQWVSPLNPLVGQCVQGGDKYVFKQDFILPLNCLNQVFDLDNNFYPSVLKRQEVQFRIKLQNYSISKLFAKETVFEPTKTGLCDIQLFIASKQSSTIQTKLNAKNKIIQPYVRYEQFPLTASLDSTQVNFVNNGHNSSARTALCIYQNDINEDDSTYLHGLWSTFTAAQLVANETRSQQQAAFSTDTVFFSDYNVIRGTSVEALMNGFTLSNLQQLYQETMRSLNRTQQYQFGLSCGMRTEYNWLSKYAFVISSLEMFSMDEVTDVVGDGYHSKIHKILMKYSLSPYVNQQAVKSTSIANLATKLPQIQTANVEVYQFYDQFVQIDIQTGNLIITEELSKKQE